MKLSFWAIAPGFLLLLLSALFEPHTGRHAEPGVLMQLGGMWLALGSVIVFPYWAFLFFRMCWRNFLAPNRIYEELRLARLARESGAGSSAASPEPESGRIFGRL